MRQPSPSLAGFIGTLLLAVAPALAQDARLVKDLRAGSLGSNPARLTLVAGTLFFVADSGLTGKELYQSDGSLIGTTLVKDINPGGSFTPASSDPDNLTGIEARLYFVATNGITGRDLWKSDGTVAGTVLVKDFVGTPSGLAPLDGTLFFAADGGDGQELWKSDGSTGGTVQVKDIFAGTGNSNPAYITPIGAYVFFSANDGGTTGRELWKSDGTGPGTILVKDIEAGGGLYSGSDPEDLLAAGGVLFFTADDGPHGRELWTSDGTAAGTSMVVDLSTGVGGSSPSSLVNVAGTVFFSASTSYGRELWRSDGTAVGTELVMDIKPGSALRSSDPADLTVVNSRVFFTADDGVNGRELWMSDGTLGGTFLVKDIRSGTCGSAPCSSEPANLRDVGGILYFTADDGISGRELWRSDGTVGGTVMVQDISTGAAASNPADISSLVTRQGTYTFFAANDGNAGMELWLLPPPQSPPTAFFTLTSPCRLVDTRKPPAPLAGPVLEAWTDRDFSLTGTTCNVPPTASAVSVNITVTQPAGAGNLRVIPTGGLASTVSAINYAAGQTRANNAVVTLGYGGAVTVRASRSTGTTHFILDVNGYFE